MKITFKRIIDLQTLLMWVGLLCVVSFAMLEHMSIPIPEISSVKMPLVLVGGVCVIPLLKTFFANMLKKRYLAITMVLLLLCGFLVISMNYNDSTVSGYSPERSTIRLILYLLELFILMMAFAEKGQSQMVVQFIFRYVLLLVLVTDALMLTRVVTFGTEKLPYYLAGTKFTVVYRHFDLLVLWLIQQREKYGARFANKWFVWSAAAVVILVSIYVDCMSGVLGCVFLAWLILRQSVSKKLTKLLTTPTFFIFCILACTLIAFVIGFFLNIPVIKNLIEDVLQRDTTLTGRIKIYQNYGEAMQGHWLLGYGFGSGNVVSLQYFGCTNAQNAVLHWILQCGLVVSVLLITLFVLIMKQVKTHPLNRRVSAELLVVLVYTYVMLGIVEITYSMSFILFIALLFMLANDKGETDISAKSTIET